MIVLPFDFDMMDTCIEVEVELQYCKLSKKKQTFQQQPEDFEMSDEISDKINDNTRKERLDRDLSPSGYSQCSTGLEWDPSADVGTSSGILDDNSKIDLTASSPSQFQSKSAMASSTSHEDPYTEKTSVSQPGMTEKSDSGGSSSVIWVEIQQNLEPRNPPEAREGKLRNIGIQTSIEKGISRTTEFMENTTGSSNVYHSTPTEHYRTHMKEKNKLLNQRDLELDLKTKGRRRDRSPPQPFAVASRKSSHRHHQAHHGRVHGDDNVSPIRSRVPDKKVTSSSELSSSCLLIDKIVKPGCLSAKKEEMLSALEMHRDYHVNKVRHELKQLEKLNQLLSKNLISRSQTSTTTTTSSESQLVKTTNRHNVDESRRKLSPSKPKKASPVKAKKVVHHPPTSDYSSSSNTTVKDSSSRETYTLSGSNSGSSHKTESVPIKRKEKQSKDNPKSRDILEEKLDKLLDKFNYIADMLANNKENVPVPKKTLSNKTKSTKQKKKEPVKPPVAYFVPFPTDDGQYVFRKEDIDISQIKYSIYANKSKVNDVHRKKHSDSELHEEAESDEDELLITKNEEESAIQEIQKGNKFTLQDAFQRRNPTFINRLQEREAVIARLKAEREIRAEKKREWIRKYGENPLYELKGLESALPPKGPRLMTTKEMKELTERHYKKLPEVRDKILQRKAEEEKKTNRLMSQVFASKLRRGVLKGEINIVHSRSLIRR